MTIKPAGTTMKHFPNAFKYGTYCSGDAQAMHVMNEADEIKFTGTYEACMNYIGWFNNKSQRY